MARLLRAFSTLQRSVPVYESKEYAKLAEISGNFILEASKALGTKFYQFIPFYLESRTTTITKTFVLKLDLLPELSKLRVTSLQLGSLHQSEVDLKNLIPTTAEEYENAHLMGKMLHPAEFLDLEMVYLNSVEQEFLVFDKEGEWKEEGVSHPLLSMEKRFNEHQWMDTVAGPKAEQHGGNVYNS
jgi:hypothetical protein